MIFQCSLKKSNAPQELDILIQAGIATPFIYNDWVRFNPEHRYIENTGKPKVTFHDSYTTSLNVIITAHEFVSIVLLKGINPKLTTLDLLKTLKLNARNRASLKYTRYAEALGLSK